MLHIILRFISLLWFIIKKRVSDRKPFYPLKGRLEGRPEECQSNYLAPNIGAIQTSLPELETFFWCKTAFQAAGFGHFVGFTILKDLGGFSETAECKVARTDKSYSEPVLCTFLIWARQIGLSTWVQPYKSDSGQFCLSYNRIKYELKHFFQLIFNHNYLYLYV